MERLGTARGDNQWEAAVMLNSLVAANRWLGSSMTYSHYLAKDRAERMFHVELSNSIFAMPV